MRDLNTLELRPFLWFGAEPKEPLPPLGDRIALQEATAPGQRRRSGRTLALSRRPSFTELPTMDDVVRALFGAFK
jgi:hypothetical protein